MFDALKFSQKTLPFVIKNFVGEEVQVATLGVSLNLLVPPIPVVFDKPQGIAALNFGLILLTAGVLVLTTVPSWGNWIADYPQQLASMQAPPEAAPVMQGMRGVFGPLLEQVGGYIRIVGYFVGSLLTIVSLGPIGIMIIRGERK